MEALWWHNVSPEGAARIYTKGETILQEGPSFQEGGIQETCLLTYV